MQEIRQLRRTNDDCGNMFLSETEAIFKITAIKITDNERLLLENNRIGSTVLEKSDESAAQTANIKAKLTVKYNYGNSPFSDTEDIRLISATSSYSRTGATEGVAAQSSELYYRALGDIYDASGSFVRRGYLTNTFKLLNPTFTDHILFPTGYLVRSCTSAGVNYKLICTRGVTITVYLSFI